ncbi:MAG: prohibitin family protein [Acidobacteria bacterium]|nr:prohibitin family protein [Acidobacteriota bacterium]
MIFIISIIVLTFSAVLYTKRKEGTPGIHFIAIAVISGILALMQLFVVIPAGHVGVVDLFGKVSDTPRTAGINIVNPLAKVVRMSIKTQEAKQVLDVPSKEGLSINLEMSVLFHLDPQKAPDVYRTIGVYYGEILIDPQFRSVIREVTSSYDAKALYTEERGELSKIIKEKLIEKVASRGIVIEDTPPRRIILPKGLTGSIEAKLRAEQDSLRMQFVLEKEKLEAERKRIEARGIADFQNIVSQGISEQLLRWKGIEATEELAKSANAKVVIIGSKDGLPVILDGK